MTHRVWRDHELVREHPEGSWYEPSALTFDGQRNSLIVVEPDLTVHEYGPDDWDVVDFTGEAPCAGRGARADCPRCHLPEGP